MSKIGLIIGREYLTRVRKKSFLITTILVPLVIMGFYAAIIAIAVKGGTDQQSIAVIDNAGLFKDSIPSKNSATSFKLIHNETEQSFIPKYKAAGYKAFLYIPNFDIKQPAGFVLHSASSASLSTTSAAEKVLNDAIMDKRLVQQGIDPALYKNIAADVNVENTIDTREGGKKSVAAIAYGVSFACGMLIYLMMIIYGTQVMRGVTEEKTNRIAEVVVSSVKPFELMMGKIVGIGAVGLTQFAIWIILVLFVQMLLPVLAPGLVDQMNNLSTDAAGRASMAATITQGISSLPLLKIGL
jgi:ABC-2 type transport system permease protein